jgi:hypothetical protein
MEQSGGQEREVDEDNGKGEEPSAAHERLDKVRPGKGSDDEWWWPAPARSPP